MAAQVDHLGRPSKTGCDLSISQLPREADGEVGVQALGYFFPADLVANWKRTCEWW